MNSNTTPQFIRKVIQSDDLVEGIDYEIASIFFYGVEEKFDVLDEVVGMKSQVYLRELDINRNIYNELKRHFNEKGINHSRISSTLEPHFSNCDVFYLLDQEIDFSVAFTFGFGVVKMLRNEYKDLYLLYNFNKVNEEGFEESDIIQEGLALKMYLQYVNPEYKYDTVELLIRDNEKIARSLMTRNKSKVIERFQEIFKMKTDNSMTEYN